MVYLAWLMTSAAANSRVELHETLNREEMLVAIERTALNAETRAILDAMLALQPRVGVWVGALPMIPGGRYLKPLAIAADQAILRLRLRRLAQRAPQALSDTAQPGHDTNTG